MKPLHQVLLQRGRFTVLAQSQIITLRDGSAVTLHRLIEGRNPEPARFLRAMLHAEGGIFIIDLGELARPLDKDLRQCLPRDSDGIVQYTLRQHYPNGAQLRVAIAERCQVSFRPCEQLAGAGIEEAVA